MAETTINYASKFSDIVDERFTLKSVTDGAVNKDYDFDGVNTVSVYSADVAPLNDYKRTNSGNRYGTPVELGNAKQVLELTQDKSFTFTIDRGNYDDTMMANSAGQALEREIAEVIVPTVDKYRLAKMAKNAGIVYESNIVGATAYCSFIEVSKLLTESRVPLDGRIAFLTPDFYYRLLLDPTYTGVADRAAALAAEGGAKMVDGAKIVVVPSDYLPKNTSFLITHPCACTSPIKLAEYTIHDKPQGVSGWLVEGRIYYDAFVLNNKKKAIALCTFTQSEEATE